MISSWSASPPSAEMKRAHLNIIRAAVIAIALVFIVFGISRGENAVVLRKAIRICLECIGLG